MKLNFEQGYISVDDINIVISKLNKVGLIDIDFINVKITFAYLYAEDYFFVYSDTVAYEELLKEIAGNRKAMRQKLLRYQNDFGVEHSLWKQLLQYTCEKFDVNEYSYSDMYPEQSGLSTMSDYFSMRYDKRSLYPRRVNSIEEAYKLLSSVLPQNYSATRRNYLKQEAEEKLKKYADICGNNLENRENYLEKLEKINGSSLDRWNASKEELQLLKAKLQGYILEGIFDAKGISDIQESLDYCIDFVCGRVDKLNENALLQQYGPISDLKITLRENINRLGFMELLDLYKEYKEKENLLCSKARHAGMKLNEFPYGEYIDIYRLGSVLISDKIAYCGANRPGLRSKTAAFRF